MRSTFSGLNTALLALIAQRKALDVSAHNVANANTEGYTRQEAVMRAVHPYSATVAQIGGGVEVATIRRLRDSFLDYQIRGQTWSLGRWEATRNSLEEIETVFNEPSDSGIASLLSKMWGAWQDLSANPESYVTRAAVVENATALTGVLRRDSAQLVELRRGAEQQIGLKVSEIGGWLRQIAALNGQIQKVRLVGDEGTDLRDRRDLLVDGLARAVQIGYEEQADGAVTIWLGDRAAGEEQTLVEGSQSLGLRVDSASGAVLWDDGDPVTLDAAAQVQSGELAALLDVRDTVLNPEDPDSLAGRLEALGKALIDEVNALHAAGYGLVADPTGTGEKFFTGSGAADIAVNSVLALDPNKIRAAAAPASSSSLPGDPGEPGDGGGALEIGQLQSRRVLSGSTATIGDWYQTLIAKIGIDVQQARGMAANQKLLVDHLARNREAVSGVSLDEEAANLVRFERAFQAAARVMTVMDAMLDRIVNDMGIVGR